MKKRTELKINRGPKTYLIINLITLILCTSLAILASLMKNIIALILLFISVYTLVRIMMWFKVPHLIERSKSGMILARLIAPKLYDNILYVTVGDGLLLMSLAKIASSNCLIVGTDLWGGFYNVTRKEALNNIRLAELYDRINLVEATCFKLPFEDESFDVVATNFTLSTLSPEKRKKVLEELIRVLRINGWLFLVETASDLIFRWRINEKLEKELERFGIKIVNIVPLEFKGSFTRLICIVCCVKKVLNKDELKKFRASLESCEENT